MSGTDRDRLDGRRALVTGGSKGSGKAVAERLRELGADVYVSARSMPEGYEFPDRFIVADTSTAKGAETVAKRCEDALEELRALVCDDADTVRRVRVHAPPTPDARRPIAARRAAA